MSCLRLCGQEDVPTAAAHWGHTVLGRKQAAVGKGHYKTQVTQYGTPDYNPTGIFPALHTPPSSHKTIPSF